MFHSTNVSFAWQAALESTRRIIPLPPFTQASSTPDGLALTPGANTIKTAIAASPRQAIPALRIKVLFIRSPFLRRGPPHKIWIEKRLNVVTRHRLVNAREIHKT